MSPRYDNLRAELFPFQTRSKGITGPSSHRQERGSCSLQQPSQRLPLGHELPFPIPEMLFPRRPTQRHRHHPRVTRLQQTRLDCSPIWFHSSLTRRMCFLSHMTTQGWDFGGSVPAWTPLPTVRHEVSVLGFCEGTHQQSRAGQEKYGATTKRGQVNVTVAMANWEGIGRRASARDNRKGLK
jgi:hypothetical protein